MRAQEPNPGYDRGGVVVRCGDYGSSAGAVCAYIYHGEQPAWRVFVDVRHVECGYMLGMQSAPACVDDFGNIVLTGPLQ